MRTETPAEIAITRTTADGQSQTIYCCRAHVFATIGAHRQNGDEELAITTADPAHHGCKGCLEDWAKL